MTPPPTEPPKTSASVMKVWDDDNNAAGLRPANVRVTLSNGQVFYLNAANGWSVTVNDLPAMKNGQPITYTWSEQSVPGYVQTGVTRVGNTTIMTNRFEPPFNPDEMVEIFEGYDTPLGLDVIINHVGDCFD